MTTHTIHRQSTATTRMISGISVALEVGSCKSANGFGEVKLEVVNALSPAAPTQSYKSKAESDTELSRHM